MTVGLLHADCSALDHLKSSLACELVIDASSTETPPNIQSISVLFVSFLNLTTADIQNVCDTWVPSLKNVEHIISLDPGINVKRVEEFWNSIVKGKISPSFSRLVWPSTKEIFGIGLYCNGLNALNFLQNNILQSKIIELSSDLECDVMYAIFQVKFNCKKIFEDCPLTGKEIIESIKFPGTKWRTGVICKFLDDIKLFALPDCKLDHLFPTKKPNLENIVQSLTSDDFSHSIRFKQNNLLVQVLEYIIQFYQTNGFQVFNQLNNNFRNVSEGGNILDNLPKSATEEEAFQSLLPFLESKKYKISKIERIVSTGQCSAEWYDQSEGEFVMIIQGSAAVECEGDKITIMSPGNWIYLPHHCKHRVFWTNAIETTVWLAIFFE